MPETAAPTKKDAHPGCVKRVLNYRDRLLILNAAAESLKGKGTIVALAKFQKLNDLLDGEGVNDYFDAMDVDFTERAEAWRVAVEARMRDSKAPKVGPRPRRTRIELRGKDATFHIPSKLDTFIIDTLKKAEIEARHAEFAVELAQKFGVPIDD